MLWKRLGLDFLHGNNFPQQFRENKKCQEGWTPFFFTPSPIYSKIREELTTQLAQASKVASCRSNSLLEEESGRPKWAWLLFVPPFFTKCTPLYLFWQFFFRNVTKLYEFRNDTYFPSARLRILTDYVFTPFLPFEEVTETYGLRKNTSFRLPPHYGISRIAQACFLLISEMSRDFIYCATRDAKYLKAANQRLHVIK